jgi:penicillin amidase
MSIPASAVLRQVRRLLAARLAGPPRPPRPGTSADVHLHGIADDVWICRDAHGIPHIFAAGESDAFFGLGYAMVQDRWWQMDLWRRTAAGRLAEIFGDVPLGGAAPTGVLAGQTMATGDLFYRAIGLARLAQADLEAHSREGRDALRAFTAGANAAREAALRAGAYPAECILLRYVPEPWTEADSLLCARLIAWLLSLSLSAHLAVGRLRAHPDLRDLLPDYPEDGPMILDGGTSAWEDAGARLLDLAQAARMPVGGAPGTGSNGWVVGPARSATGGALLANDPHLPLRFPAVWYQFTMDRPGLRLAGAALPGVPGVLVGHNGHVAWGVTNTMLDDADLYVETVDPADPARYLTPAGPRPFHETEEVVRVRGEPVPRRRTVRSTEHGGTRCPVLSDVVAPAAGGRVLALRWVGFTPWPGLDVLRRAHAARTAAEFVEALREYRVPAQNFMAADAEGTIAYVCGGRIPRRPTPTGGGPVDGASGRHDWDGEVPFEANPRGLNPAAGFVVTANQRVAAGEGAGTLPQFPEPPYRAARIRARLHGATRHTPETFAAIQTDVVSVQARRLVAGILAPLRQRFGLPKATAAAARLLEWDGAMGADSAAAALYHVWRARLLRDVIRPRLEAASPGLFEQHFSVHQLAVYAADRVLLGDDPAWYPQGKAAAVEAALVGAVEDLEAAQGPDPAAWRWGAIHALLILHPMGAVGSPLGRWLARWLRLNRGPFPQPGDGSTVNLSAYVPAAPFRPLVGPSLRVIVDLKNPGASRWVIPGGSSGDPFSPHYADQLEPWRRGEYLPMRCTTLDEARRAGPALHLLPA